MEIRLAENIKLLRRQHRLTQEQLAEALGVTVGAVHKWERGMSTPDISLIMELARFFETSVDVLLGYQWEKGSMGQAACRIGDYRRTKSFDEGICEAEKALQKYPNFFEVVYQSALLYYCAQTQECAAKALLLFQKACELIEQNTDPHGSVQTFL